MAWPYYADTLSGERLRQCYEIAPKRVRQYLESEIEHLLARIPPGSSVLELGCGYGRVTTRLASIGGRVVGIDTSTESLRLARELAGPQSICEFIEMDAIDLDFPDSAFDAVVCIQNGICAFHVDKPRLVREALRVTRTGGRVLLSSYSEVFWKHRLRWFELQSERGLIGEIDRGATGDGTIVCLDGFRSGRMSADDFACLCREIGVGYEITEVDRSSLFCEITA